MKAKIWVSVNGYYKGCENLMNILKQFGDVEVTWYREQSFPNGVSYSETDYHLHIKASNENELIEKVEEFGKILLNKKCIRVISIRANGISWSPLANDQVQNFGYFYTVRKYGCPK